METEPRLGGRVRTSALRLAHVCAHLAGANHSETLRLVERADLLLCLAERHAVLQFAQLGLGVCFFGFACAV